MKKKKLAHYEITSQQILTFPFFLRKHNRFPFFQRKQVEQFEQRGNQGGKGGLSPTGYATVGKQICTRVRRLNRGRVHAWSSRPLENDSMPLWQAEEEE